MPDTVTDVAEINFSTAAPAAEMVPASPPPAQDVATVPDGAMHSLIERMARDPAVNIDMIDLDAVMEASRERGRIAGLLEVVEVIGRLTRDTRTRGFLGDYMNAMEDMTAELKRLFEKPPESPADERDGGRT